MRDVGLVPPADERDVVRGLLLHLLDPDAHDDDPARRTRAALDALPERLVGVELVTARLLVAALDLRIDALDAADLAALVPRRGGSDADADAAGDDDDADDGGSDREHAHG